MPQERKRSAQSAYLLRIVGKEYSRGISRCSVSRQLRGHGGQGATGLVAVGGALVKLLELLATRNPREAGE
jgi:hypothetical protein